MRKVTNVEFSSCIIVISVVSQGLVLVSIIFLIYVNDVLHGSSCFMNMLVYIYYVKIMKQIVRLCYCKKMHDMYNLYFGRCSGKCKMRRETISKAKKENGLGITNCRCVLLKNIPELG